jgi:hypothetical protein
MAETLGFILGEYTLAPHLPAIYITDSNSARTFVREMSHDFNNMVYALFARNAPSNLQRKGIPYKVMS